MQENSNSKNNNKQKINAFLSFYLSNKRKEGEKKRKRNNATGNQALKKPIQIKDLYLTLNMICTFFFSTEISHCFGTQTWLP